jgi:Glycosyltransferase Family 4
MMTTDCSLTHNPPCYLPAHIARVVTIHDVLWKTAPETMPFFGRWLESRLMSEALRPSTRIIAYSHSTADDIITAFPHVRDKVRVVHLGVTGMGCPDSVQSLTSLGIHTPYFLCVGALGPRKNLLSNEHFRSGLAQKTAANVARFSWQKTAEQTRAIFLEAKTEHRKTRS